MPGESENTRPTQENDKHAALLTQNSKTCYDLDTMEEQHEYNDTETLPTEYEKIASDTRAEIPPPDTEAEAVLKDKEKVTALIKDITDTLDAKKGDLSAEEETAIGQEEFDRQLSEEHALIVNDEVVHYSMISPGPESITDPEWVVFVGGFNKIGRAHV